MRIKEERVWKLKRKGDSYPGEKEAGIQEKRGQECKRKKEKRGPEPRGERGVNQGENRT